MIQYLTFFILFLSSSFGWTLDENKLEEANKDYRQGELAQTLLERKKAFNQALALYLELEQEIKNFNHSSKLYEAIANSYFQLGEYARSILYNYRALTIEPQNLPIQDHLHLSQKKLGLSPQMETTKLDQILSFNDHLSLPQRLELFFWLTLITVCSYAFLIYFPFIWIKKIAGILFLIVCLLFLNLLSSLYLSPIAGILIEPTGLYRDPTAQQVQLLSTPLLEGKKVLIIDVNQEGYWLKIETPEGIIGYIPAKSIRII
jgi:tetratricopeptide (TPR) repeat protein